MTARDSTLSDSHPAIADPQPPTSNCQSSIVNLQSPIHRPVVSIGNRQIGAAHPVYVIAEAGVNHNGDVAAARRLIDAAHEAGADAVKFQVFSADRLASASAPACAYQKQHGGQVTSQRDLLRRLELKLAAFRDLEAHADRLGIHFLATPFGLEELQFLAGLGLPAVKIASPDIVNVPLLKAAAQTAMPLIVSTGASILSEIDDAVRIICGPRTPDSQSPIRHPQSAIPRRAPLRVAAKHRSPGALQSSIPNRQSSIVNRQSPIPNRLILLHCVSAYPTQPHEARLACVGTLARRFGVPVGFSDHTPDSDFSALAVAAGAVILEKHLTLDRQAPGPDHFFSLEPRQFGRYVAAARRAREALGDAEIRVAPVEMEIREYARRSIVAASAIAAGQVIEAHLLAVQRPGGGIEPGRWNDVVGRVAGTDIPPATRLSWSMIR
jgi:N-acetylneuraminate synthase/N,N'-diacetyllegionaminate synthase